MSFISKIKFLGNYFFIWSMPLVIIILNILKMREVFGINVLIGLILGLLINIIWELTNHFLDRKEYHKNLLWYSNRYAWN